MLTNIITGLAVLIENKRTEHQMKIPSEIFLKSSTFRRNPTYDSIVKELKIGFGIPSETDDIEESTVNSSLVYEIGDKLIGKTQGKWTSESVPGTNTKKFICLYKVIVNNIKTYELVGHYEFRFEFLESKEDKPWKQHVIEILLRHQNNVKNGSTITINSAFYPVLIHSNKSVIPLTH